MEVSIKRQKEILTLMRNQFETVRLRSICDSLKNLLLTRQIIEFEYDYMKNVLVEHKPTETNQYKKFTETFYWRGDKIQSIDDGFWWKIATFYPETIPIRMNYLTALINNLK